jgi:circadian clock protein KaiB
MTRSQRLPSSGRAKRVPSERSHPLYVLRLYVAGFSPRSVAAIATVKRACREHLRDRYHLEIVNIHDQPTLAKAEQIIAAPTLIKKLPLPLRRIIGNMANVEKLLVGLDLRQKVP